MSCTRKINSDIKVAYYWVGAVLAVVAIAGAMYSAQQEADQAKEGAKNEAADLERQAADSRIEQQRMQADNEAERRVLLARSRAAIAANGGGGAGAEALRNATAVLAEVNQVYDTRRFRIDQSGGRYVDSLFKRRDAVLRQGKNQANAAIVSGYFGAVQGAAGAYAGYGGGRKGASTTGSGGTTYSNTGYSRGPN